MATAIASSSPRSWVVPHLERVGLDGPFDAICCRDDVERVKPAPDLYLLAAARVGAPPARCLAVEDSANGIAAAAAAGCYCVAVANPVTAMQTLDGAHLRLASLGERRLASLADLIDSV